MADINTYVEFYFPGLIFDESSSSRKVASRDTIITIPDSAFAFRFFDIMSTVENGVKMVSDRINLSPMYYYGGRIMTLDDVRREMPKEHTLISNMQRNGCKRVIQCRTGNFKPFGDEDVLIEEHS